MSINQNILKMRGHLRATSLCLVPISIYMNNTVGPLTDDFGDVILDDGVNVKLLNEYLA